jgi:hypothetical protein
VSATASPLPAVDGQLIDEYVAGLSFWLVGPRPVKADLLAEARDGLVDAAEAYTEAGSPPSEAAARAVADFGSYRQVAAAFQTELAAAQGRRTALLVAIAMPTVLLGSRLMWMASPWSNAGQQPTSGYLVFAYVMDILQVTAAIMAGLTLLGYGWGSRFLPAARVPAPVLLTRLMGVGVLAFIVAEAVTGAVIYAWSVHMWAGAAQWPPMVIGAVVLPLFFVKVARSALRCLRAASAPAVGTGTLRSSS